LNTCLRGNIVFDLISRRFLKVTKDRHKAIFFV